MRLCTKRDGFVPVAATGCKPSERVATWTKRDVFVSVSDTGRRGRAVTPRWTKCRRFVWCLTPALSLAFFRARSRWRGIVRINKNRLVDTASSLIDVHSFTGDEQRMAA